MLQDLPDLTGMTVYLREFPKNIPLTLHPQMDAQSRHKLATMDIDTYIELGSTTRQERQ
jgi:hypothetical protein